MRKWTIEERKRQAELIKKWQPWQQSTGAKSIEGKAKTARNAYKGGSRKQLNEIKLLVRDAKNLLKNLC